MLDPSLYDVLASHLPYTEGMILCGLYWADLFSIVPFG
jgi:hypothetical protein